MAISVGRPPKFDTPEQMQKAIDIYFNDCQQRGAPLTMSGLALAIGFEDRKSLVDYNQKSEFSPTIKRAKKIVEQSIEELMLNGKGQVAGVIFNAKNNFGWVDKQDIDQNTNLNANLNVQVIGFGNSSSAEVIDYNNPAQLHA